MTNREWYIYNLSKKTNKELAHYLECEDSPWCKECKNNDCAGCAEHWFNEIYKEPMPEIKNGMFVKLKDSGLGVVVHNNIILQDGGWRDFTTSKNDINEIFDTSCFSFCNKNHRIWNRN